MQLALKRIAIAYEHGAENGRSFDPADSSCLGSGLRVCSDRHRLRPQKISSRFLERITTSAWTRHNLGTPRTASSCWPQSRTGFRKNSVYRSSIDSQKSN